MVSSGNQNQFPSSLAPLGDFLKAFGVVFLFFILFYFILLIVPWGSFGCVNRVVGSL